MKKRVIAICAVVFLLVGLSSCSKTKSCAAYSQADVEQTQETES